MEDHSPENGDRIVENSNETQKIIPNDEEELENDLNLDVGNFEQAPKFMQDNEYIKTGYLLNCTNLKKTFKSLIMWHNETINIWSHLLGAFFFLF